MYDCVWRNNVRIAGNWLFLYRIRAIDEQAMKNCKQFFSSKLAGPTKSKNQNIKLTHPHKNGTRVSNPPYAATMQRLLRLAMLLHNGVLFVVMLKQKGSWIEKRVGCQHEQQFLFLPASAFLFSIWHDAFHRGYCTLGKKNIIKI